MTDTVNLGLPFIEASQAQKHVTHNESLRILDALVMLSVKDRDLSAPPDAPAEGDRYLVKPAGTGAFAGRDDQVAHYADGGWTFYPPRAGWLAYVEDEGALVAWDGGAWGGIAAGGGGGGSGDVLGPSSALLNRIAIFSNADGKHIADGGAAISTDGTFASNSDAKLPTEKAVRTFVREKLAANRTYYVRTDGSDSNDGLSNTSGGAFLTIQKAVDTAAALDLSIYDVTIQVGNGTYNAGVILKALTGAGLVTIVGDAATPANVTISTSVSCIQSPNALTSPALLTGRWKLKGLKLATSVANGACIDLNGPMAVLMENIDFGASTSSHIRLANKAVLVAPSGTSLTISGGAGQFLITVTGALAFIENVTITLTGTPNFGNAFLRALRQSTIYCSGSTWSGSATAKKYDADGLSLIQYGGATLPGGTAGTATNGAQAF